MNHEKLIKELNKTMDTYKSMYKSTLAEFEEKIKDVPSEEGKLYYEMMAKVKKATRENDLNTLRSLASEIRNKM